MLEFVPEKRATAQEMLAHPWLRGDLPESSGGRGRERAEGWLRPDRHGDITAAAQQTAQV